MRPELIEKIKKLDGPVLVLGAGGFIGANLLLMLRTVRQDAVGFVHSRKPQWRLPEGTPVGSWDDTPNDLSGKIKIGTIFDCIAHGAYSFQTDTDTIYSTNLRLKAWILEKQSKAGCYIHAGSSSEYGANCYRPFEDQPPTPNSHYACSKVAAAALISYFGHERGMKCCNLRLFSVYGPLEEPSRLIPQLILQGAHGRYPPLTDPGITRDFVYVDDACEAFIDAALNLQPEQYGESFNIGTGIPISIRGAATTARESFKIGPLPRFSTLAPRVWDTVDNVPWCARTSKAEEFLNWEARVMFEEGFACTLKWWRGLSEDAQDAYEHASRAHSEAKPVRIRT